MKKNETGKIVRRPLSPTRVAALLLALSLVGCASTGDLTRHESSTCEVHQCPMTVLVVPCHPGGNSCYLPEFESAMLSQFPHHSRTRFSEDHGYLYARRFRTHVCGECTKAYDRWVVEHKKA